MSNITPFGYNIERDSSGNISLTDLWKAGGSIDSKAIKRWLELESTKDFIDKAARFLKVAKNDLIKTKRGKGGGTIGHEQIALEYAQYLDPRLAVYVNNLFLNPEAATNHAVAIWEKKGKSTAWISERMSGIASRKDFTKTLQDHGVKGSGYSDCTNAIYKPLWGGGADIVRTKKGLSNKSDRKCAM